MIKTVFLTYGTGRFIPIADALCNSAIRVGFDEARSLSPEDLEPGFKELNAGLLKEARGAGFWVWKPQIILQALRELRPHDLLVYSDAGRNSYNELRIFPEHLAVLARKKGMLLNATAPQHGNLAKWTKRDCLIRLDMDRKEVCSLPQIQANWSFWTHCDAAFRVLEEWRDFCCDPVCVSDSLNTLGLPNYPEFLDHRHDQSILTLLIYRDNLPHLDYSFTVLHKILGLRKKSSCSQRFMSRIDDAELMEGGRMVEALARSFFDLRKSMPQSIKEGR